MSESSDFVAYHYDPSLIAAAVSAGVFGASTIFHCYQVLRTRTWYMVSLIVGGLLECAGFAARIQSSNEAPNFKLPAYIVQSLCILVAPAFTAATVYMALNRIICVVDGGFQSPLRPRLFTLTFVSGDVISFMVQSTGASIMTKKKANAASTAKWIIIVGLAIQVVFLSMFIVIAITFHRRMRKNSTLQAKRIPGLWQVYLGHLYAASLAILVRSIFRLVEYIQGENGYFMHHEIFLYIFDATLIACVMLLLNTAHPSMVTALQRGSKAVWIFRVRTMEKLEDDVGTDLAAVDLARAQNEQNGESLA
ncbi:hypothetical protein H2200_007469 [Cladophialophora chaetospira]|uniref:RTA1 domain protein n=1 Tax=Cladophialophora chaetospira TaxID=386627 RepID=A0AA38X7Z4_9EURO|nr:hypothetical protein H2200_007469 [Cladophialophora chaetospira]